jgi:hypothetical protein
MTKQATSGVSSRESIAQFLARNDADSLTMRARIRGIDEPEEARKFARVEAEHQGRQEVVARANQRAEELAASD